MGAAQERASNAASACRIQPAQDLPAELRETSGLAASRRAPGVFWTHNDAGNQPILFAVDSLGRVTARVRVPGATLVDWEDVAAGPCGRGDCLYVGDVGDNSAKRRAITVYEMPEPAPGAAEASARPRHARFPGKPQDAEAIFALENRLYVVTKGRHGPIDLYRFPAQATADTVELERVRNLWPEPRDAKDRVTSATTSPDGRWVGIRTYRTLYLFPAATLVSGGDARPREIDLTPLREAQGEGIAIAANGAVWTTSEATGRGSMPRMARMDCALGGGEG